MRRLKLFLIVVVLGGCTGNLAPFGLGADYDFQARVAYADDLREKGQFDAASAIYEQLVSTAGKDRNRAMALEGLAETYLASSRLTSATSTYREVLLIDANNAHARTGLGIALALQNLYSEAEIELRRAYAVGYAGSYSPLGVVLDLQGRHAEAQQVYLSGFDVWDTKRELRANLALSYALAGQYDEAIALSREISNLLVPSRYRRNHLLILLLADRRTEAGAFQGQYNIPRETIAEITQIATQLRTSDPSSKARLLAQLLL